MKKALVTGATGFIGSHVVRRLVRRGLEVHVLCRPRSRFTRLEKIRGQLTAHVVSLHDRAGLRRIVQTVAPDYVLHLAAATMHGGAAAAPAALVRTNLLGTVNLIDACDDLDYACFVNTGDSFEYGPGRGPLRESQRCRPTTLDGITKLAATLYAQQAAHAHKKPIVTLRLFSVFGPQDDPRRLVPRVVAGALAGTPLRLSRPRIARDYLYVDDLVDLYLAVMRQGAVLAGDVLNTGSGRQTTIGEIVETVLTLTGSCSEVRWNAFPTAPHDRERWVADMTRTRKLVAWRPRISLEQGLAAIIRSVGRC
jgi:UDP-glucose 4-epimerase